MYLSKINMYWNGQINYYEIHRKIWKLFPNHGNEYRSFLFRIEQKLPNKGIQLLLQSSFEPNDTSTDIEILGKKSFSPNIKNGDMLRFRIMANPIKTIKDSNGRLNANARVKSCRVPLITVNEQESWLKNHLGKAGEILELSMNDIPPILFSKKNHRGKIQPVLYEGIIQTTDTEALNNYLLSGIGPGKAFGCGLLSLARYQQA